MAVQRQLDIADLVQYFMALDTKGKVQEPSAPQMPWWGYFMPAASGLAGLAGAAIGGKRKGGAVRRGIMSGREAMGMMERAMQLDYAARVRKAELARERQQRILKNKMAGVQLLSAVGKTKQATELAKQVWPEAFGKNLPSYEIEAVINQPELRAMLSPNPTFEQARQFVMWKDEHKNELPQDSDILDIATKISTKMLTEDPAAEAEQSRKLEFEAQKRLLDVSEKIQSGELVSTRTGVDRLVAAGWDPDTASSMLASDTGYVTDDWLKALLKSGPRSVDAPVGKELAQAAAKDVGMPWAADMFAKMRPSDFNTTVRTFRQIGEENDPEILASVEVKKDKNESVTREELSQLRDIYFRYNQAALRGAAGSEMGLLLLDEETLSDESRNAIENSLNAIAGEITRVRELIEYAEANLGV